uniref:receptor protein-tyrosine kinase n=1 Tax=Setaria digitata TaxID=48799 RepID=A0A915PIW2_9BILA
MSTAVIYVFLITVLLAHVNAIMPTHENGKGLRPWLQTGPPRFKQNQRVVHEVFLNDKAIFKCTALARPAPKIHWFRNGEFLDHTTYANNERLRENKKHFSLEIRRVEVSDQGSWACKVWNQAGSIFRNFTLEIIDFCDYFFMHEFPAQHVPEKCICLWYLTGEYRKDGINWTEVNDERCEAFKKYASKVRKPLGKKICENGACGNELIGTDPHEVLQGVGLHDAVPNDILHDHQQQQHLSGLQATALLSDPVKLLDWLVANDWVDVSHLLSNLLTRQKIAAIKPALSDWSTLDAAEKRLRARTLLQQEITDISASITTNDMENADPENKGINNLMNNNESYSNEIDEKISEKSPLDLLMHDQPRADNSDEVRLSDIAPKRIHVSVVTTTASATRAVFFHVTNPVTPRSTIRRVFPLQKVPPYFKVRDEDADTSVITPSGRTIKLQCKAGGQPEPQVIWFNNNKKVITTEVRRPVGTEFRLRKNTLEIEDVAESDSGDYTCEAFNSAGSVTRTFKLRVVDRMRSKPIIVPNILVNQTVDVNSTVNFTCKVISDLTPHIVWMRIEMTNDSIYYWNETDRKYVFRYTDMQSVENAIVTKTSQDSSTLTIANVTVADQGMYACVSGNHLGHAIANATLTVNEFHAMTLATGNPDTKWSRASIVAVVILLILLILTLATTLFYIFCIRKRSKAQIAEMEQFIGPVKKRVIVTKRPVDPENDGWSDMPSTYQIHVEPVATSGTRRRRLSSDLTFLSDYEIPPDPAWEVERSRLHFVEMLGEGAFGEVWKAILRMPMTRASQGDMREEEVAVKKLKASAHEKELIDLVSEMETFKIIGHHENLLRLIGCCTGTGPLYVIVELCKHGNLRDFLRAHRPRDADSGSQVPETTNVAAGAGSSSDHYLEPRRLQRKLTVVSTHDQPVLIKHLTQRHLVQFAWQVAKGMEFMASRKIIHRDLAARNVLVADGFVMKISDFGLSRDVHYNDYYRKKGNGRLPIKWMALEALDSHVYTIYSDVWSFGILLWEIMTLGGTPYPSIAMQQLYSCLKEGYRMEAPDNCPEEVYDVMVACWQEKPENRPSFDTLVDYFDWMLTQSARDHENYLEVQSTASDGSEEVRDIAPPPPPPLRSMESPSKHRKARPLSEPVISPSEPVVDPDSDPEFENDSHPLLPGEKAILYEEQSRPGVHHAFIRRCPALPPADASLLNERSSNSTATVSIDSAIGSPLWSAGAVSALLDLDANERGDSPMSYKKRRLSNEPCSYSEVGKKVEIIGEKNNRENVIRNSGLLNPQYVNVENAQAVSVEKGKLRGTKFPFPPVRHTRFSDSTAYEADSIHMNSMRKPALEGSASAFTVNQASTLLTKKDRENPNETSVSNSSNNQQRRFSIESSSSGRGGSSGMSSAEGLGGVAEFCQIECSRPETTLYELYSQQQQQPKRKIPLPTLKVDK